MNQPHKSKINYTATLIAIVTLVLIVFNAPDDVKIQVLTLTTLLGPTLIVTFRTWYTGNK